MIDTVVLESPFLSEEVAQQIEQACIRRSAVDLSTGEQVWEITTGSLKGSFDNRISVRVMREQWMGRIEGSILEASEPWVRIECSVHKAMLGHNIYGGSSDFKRSCNWLISTLEGILEVSLPPWYHWLVQRVDVAEVYDLGTFVGCQEWMRGMQQAEYPRRKRLSIDLETLMFPGRTTTVKFYHKGPEFYKNDRPRLLKLWDRDKVHNLQELSNRLLRVEVGIRARKLQSKYGPIVTIPMIEDEWLAELHEQECQRILREGSKEMETVRTANAVEERLYSHYGSQLGSILVGMWYRLTVHGEKKVKKQMSERTFYRQRKQLLEAGCSWKGSDVIKAYMHVIPVDFSPVRSNSRRLSSLAPEVEALLAKVV